MTPLLPRMLGVRKSSRGATLLEFTLVAPIITLVGMLTLQWALSFHARNQLQHAGFMAARAGATSQAQPEAIAEAYAQALAGLYGGGRNAMEVEQAIVLARADLASFTRIEVLNPSTESFSDWSDPRLQQRLQAPRRVIPNDGLAMLSPERSREIGALSGQTLADANQLQIRITTGLPLQVPFASGLIRQVLRWTDAGADAFSTSLIAAGRMPSTVEVLLRMQSPAMESSSTRSVADRARPGVAGGTRPDAGRPPAACTTLGCADGADRSSAVSARLAPDPFEQGSGSVQPMATPSTPSASFEPLFCPLPG